MRTGESIIFYDWDRREIVRRIEVSPKLVVWKEDGSGVLLALEESAFVLSCDKRVANGYSV